MDKNEAKVRIEKLKKEINKHRHAYHVLDSPTISDEALDSLKRELLTLEQEHPDLVTPDSPTQRVGGEPSEQFNKVVRTVPMLSFNDVFSKEELIAWWRRLENHLKKTIEPELYLEPKIDGFAIELTYRSGILVLASTRGDGLVGEDVTQNIKTIEMIPLNLNDLSRVSVPEELVVRGEVFMSKKEFKRVNEAQRKNAEKEYANPRNTAAGSIRQLDPKIAASRKLEAIIYGLVTNLGQKTHADEHRLLAELGFRTDNINHMVTKSLEEVFVYKDRWEKDKDELPYQIDGLVVVVNQKEVFDKLGSVGKAPRGAVAYKFSPEEATTILEDIKIQIGRTGVLTPVAILTPVEVGGVTIRRATLHNFDQIERLDLKIGDTVLVSRAGDVIPQIKQAFKELRTGREKAFLAPERCPVDGSRVIQEGAIYRCSNQDCGARLREKVSHFVSRKAFDIRGMGQKIVSRFIEEGLIRDFADIFALEKEDIAYLEGFGEKSAEKLLDEIEAKKFVGLPKLIYALGILNVGEETAHMLEEELSLQEKVNSPSDLGKTIGRLSMEELMRLPDIGPKVGENIKEWFSNPKNIELLNRLERVGIRVKDSGGVHKKSSDKLNGKVFVLTKALNSFSREEAKKMIRLSGGRISESVNRKTDYLVVGEDPGAKLEKAKEYGVQVIKEEELRDLLS